MTTETIKRRTKVNPVTGCWVPIGCDCLNYLRWTEVRKMADDRDDYCWECSANGDDYFVNDEGELECYCPYCSQSGYDDDD